MAKSYEKWATEVAHKLQIALNLQDWDIRLHFDEDDPEGDPDTVAWVCSDYRYLTAHVYLTPGTRQEFKNGRYNYIGYIITHELVHLLLKPVQQFAIKTVSEITEPLLRDAIEQTTQRITRAMIKNLPKTFFSL
jgi:hypothetical protein